MTDLLAPSINSQKSLACSPFKKKATLSDTGSNVPKKNSPRVTFARSRQWTPPSFEYPTVRTRAAGRQLGERGGARRVRPHDALLVRPGRRRIQDRRRARAREGQGP